MDQDHKADADRGEGDNHPRRPDAAELGFFFKILTKAQNDKANTDRERDKANQQIVGVGHSQIRFQDEGAVRRAD